MDNEGYLLYMKLGLMKKAKSLTIMGRETWHASLWKQL